MLEITCPSINVMLVDEDLIESLERADLERLPIYGEDTLLASLDSPPSATRPAMSFDRSASGVLLELNTAFRCGYACLDLGCCDGVLETTMSEADILTFAGVESEELQH